MNDRQVEALADRLDKFLDVLESARRCENKAISVWSDDVTVVEDAVSALRSRTPSAPDVAMREAHVHALNGLYEACEDRRNDKGPDKTTGEHLLGLIGIIKNTPRMPVDKIARWTGFIQGVLAARGVISVDVERNRTRPIFTSALSASEAKAGEPVREIAEQIVQLINNLRGEEGDSVTILCENPDGPNAVECNGGWTNWRDKRFEGPTIIDALAVANIECIQIRAALDYGKKWAASAAPTPPQVDREAVARAIVAGWIEDCEGEVQFNYLQSQQLQDRIIHALAPAQEGE